MSKLFEKIIAGGTLLAGTEMLITDGVALIGGILWDLSHDGYLASGDLTDFSKLNLAERVSGPLFLIGGTLAICSALFLKKNWSSKRPKTA